MKLKFNGFLVLLIVLVAQITFAQERVVSGVVSDNAGMPFPGVSVLVKGTQTGTQTDFDGKFPIKATPSQVLVFSYVGMKAQEAKASSASVNVKMVSSAVELEGVVVTAFGQKKQKRSIASGTTVVSARDITEVTNTNLFESLSGKVAGVDITAPAQVGASSKVIIRGYNTISGATAPLYVVDGSPIQNGSASGTGNTRSYDSGNGIGDIDPNNIESMTVLKGAAASALYGSRASNGVIVITTKSAKNKSKLSVEIMTSTDYAEVARIPHLQNDFGQGWNGKSWSSWSGSPNTTSNENGSWGPAFNGEIRLWGAIINSGQQIKPYVALENNVKNFFELGNTYTNDVRVSGGGENSNFSLYFSDVKSDGIVPTLADLYRRKTISMNGGITEGKMTIKGTINYVKKDQNVVNTGQGADAGEGNTLTQELLQIPRDVSIVDLEDYTNNAYNTNSNYFSPYTNNPYWSVKENATVVNGNRFYGNGYFSYKINDRFSASYQLGGDYSSEAVKSYGAVVKFLPGSAQALGAANEVVGGVTESIRERLEFDNNFILNYSKTIDEDFGINAFVGFNTNQRKTSALQGQITNLDIPNFYELSNSSIKPAVTQSNSERKSYGVFASFETSYKNFLYLTLTGRNDWTSTLPIGNNSYFYPSAALSGIVLDNTDTFLKLRASYAQLGNDTGAYNTESAMISGNSALGFGNILLPIGGVNGYEFSGLLGNSELKPEMTTEYEVGFESNFFKKRVNLDVALYNKSTKDLLVNRPLPASTGYTSQVANIADISNQGIELSLNLIPVKTENFKWDFTTTFTKNNSKVNDIKGDATKQLLASNYGVTFNAVEGQPLGVFSAKMPLKTDDGKYIIDGSTGFYKISDDEQIIGSSQRDFIMGFNNRMTYKNLVFTFGIDWKEGGEMYSYTKRLSHFTGNGIETTYNERNPFVIPNSVVEVVNGSGVVTGYAENTKAIGFEDITDFYNTSNNPGIENTHIIDKTFVRLRSVALTYNFPSKAIKKMGLQNASFSVYGKNLALWTPETNPYVDPELSTFGTGLLSEQGEFGANPTQRTYGASIKLTF